MIYIVTSGECSDYSIDAVFQDRNKAEAYCKCHPNAQIKEWEFFDDNIYTPYNVVHIHMDILENNGKRIYFKFQTLSKEDANYYMTNNGIDLKFIKMKDIKYKQYNNEFVPNLSIIDVLMQSTLMQLGSQQTYNSLTDKRAPNAWTQEDGGLIDFEKTYVESVVEDKNTTSVTYQIVDENGRLKGYEKDFGTIKKELLDTLKMGHNIIIGYTWPDPDNGNRLAGHEITIVGYKTNAKGEGVFICQDSDDDVAAPIELTESFLLPKIHHAGLPDSIASRDFKYEDSWKIGLREFQEMNQKNRA